MRHSKPSISRRRRVRANIFGTAKRPRLSVHRTNRHIYAQIIDDQKGQTLAATSDLKTHSSSGTKSESAKLVGQELAKVAKAAKIEKVVFDRGGFKYHGRLKALANSARAQGLKF